MAHSGRSRHKIYQILASIAGLILLLVWLEGGFNRKTPPGTAEAAEGAAKDLGPVIQVELKEIDDIRSWPGTVTARTVAQIASKVPARVLEIRVGAGDPVKTGQVLARLDEQELRARLNQARAALAAAEAHSARAGADARRTQNLFDQEAATRQMLDAALAASRSSAAQVAEARAAIAAAESVAGEGILRAPFDGAVIKRLMDPGDMALPGQPILTMQSVQHLRVEAAIPESCARLLQQGQGLKALIGSEDYPAKVEEIAPAADPQTRTVLIKAALDPQAHTQPGTFVWLEQACGRYSALLIPEGAVRRTGQLENVRVVLDGKSTLRHVRTGKIHDGSIEILSGLKEGERVLSGGGK